MTNYSGAIKISGSIREGNGVSGTISGTLGINLSTTLDSARNGSVVETVSGYLYAQYSYPNGGSGSNTIPFDFSSQGVTVLSGDFQINKQIPVAIQGSEFGITLSGAVSSNQQSLSEVFAAAASGTYQGVPFNATLSGTGSLSVTPTLTTLTKFLGTSAAFPDAGLVEDSAGNLFGTASGIAPYGYDGQYGHGAVFEITNTSTGYATTPNIVASFINPANGTDPDSLIADSAGDLFGTAGSGGAYGAGTAGGIIGDGTVFEITRTPTGYAAPITLANFNGTDGAGPTDLISDASGDLFGIAQGGGAYDRGTVFEIAKTSAGYSNTPIVLVNYDFATVAEYMFPTLVADAFGDLFGTTYDVGQVPGYYGSIFEIAKTATGYASTPTTLFRFNGANGSAPDGLIVDGAGDLFGTTVVGNLFEVFELAKTSTGYASTPTILASFSNLPSGFNGIYQNDPMLVDGAGDLFGTMSTGGTHDWGFAYEIPRTSSGYATPIVLVNFDNLTTGAKPNPELIANAAGDIFGTTFQGLYSNLSEGAGTVFELSNAGFVVSSVTITGAAASQVTSDTSSLTPFRGVVVSDTGAGQTETVTVTQSSAANGVLSNLGGFNPTTSPGVYSDTGTAASVTAAMDALVFKPTANQVTAGQSVVTTFTIQDTDTAGFTVANSTTTVVAAPPVTIQSNGVTSLVKVATQYALYDNSGTGPWLIYQGNFVTSGEFGASVVPVGAVKTTSGYEVAWSLGGNQFIVWNTDSNGAFTSGATGVLSGASYALQSLETTFGEDLNNDGTIGPKFTPIANNGTTALVQAANEYELNPSGGSGGPFLQYGASPVSAGQFGASVVPVGAVKTTSGYEVAWSLGGNQFIVWNTDSNGAFTSGATGVLSGASYALQSLETTFGEDLNNDGTIGPKFTPIANNGTTALVQAANEYELNPSGGSGGPFLQYGASPVTAGQFGAGVVPVGAVKTTSGYEVAWSLGGNQFIVWNTDSSGAFTSGATGVVSGASYALQSLETTFGEDLNNDGAIGPKFTPIANNGTTALVQAANEYELNPSGGSGGPFLQYGAGPVTAGQFGASVVPVGAVKTTSGYEVAWSLGGNQFIVWNTDSSGAFTSGATGVVSGASYALQSLETTFGEDLNNDGAIGPKFTPIANNGTTALVQAANEYELNPSGGSGGPFLQYGASPVSAGQFGASVVPVGAVKTTSGYEVAWSLGGNQFIVWNTDSNGAFTSGATGVLSGASYALQSLETTFGEDLNNDGTIGPKFTPIANNGTTALVQAANEYELNPSGGSGGPFLQYGASPVTAGQFGAGVVPVGAVKTTSGYEVAWSLGGNQFIVWNTDSNGAFTSGATGVLSGQSFALEDLEPTFGEDLNGDGRLSAVLVTSPGPGNVLNLAAQTQATTINLGSNTSSVSAGLNAPSLSFIGTPDAITLGSAANIIEYALQPGGGIETITDFVYGQDVLNIDMNGAPSNLLRAFDTTVGGVHAIAIASSADLTQGVVLLNMTAGQTAANLLASHATFIGGHALMG